MVSTHDLELCDLALENERIANYHFQEYYREGNIYFDYKLRSGPFTTRNALYLMELAGISIAENTHAKVKVTYGQKGKIGRAGLFAETERRGKNDSI